MDRSVDARRQETRRDAYRNRLSTVRMCRSIELLVSLPPYNQYGTKWLVTVQCFVFASTICVAGALWRRRKKTTYKCGKRYFRCRSNCPATIHAFLLSVPYYTNTIIKYFRYCAHTLLLGACSMSTTEKKSTQPNGFGYSPLRWFIRCSI